MKFLLSNLIYDLRTYGIATAWWNVRFLTMTGLTRFVLGGALMNFHVHDEDCSESD